MKIRLGIVDKNKSYIRRLIDYFTNHYPEEIEIVVFSDIERLIGHLNSQRLDVVLADNELVPETANLPKSTMLAYFSDSIEIKAIRGVRAVCKYQRAEQIYREILNLYAELDRQASFKTSSGANSLILFMGASGGIGTTTAAAACSIAMAQNMKKVLYLNLEENGVIEHIFKGEGQKNLSDVLYAVKSSKANLSLKLESMVQKDRSGVYFYAPFQVTLDAAEMKAEDISEILSVLTKYGSYDAIIIDSSSANSPKRDEILRFASEILIVASNTQVSRAKLKRLLTEFSILDESRDESRIMNKTMVIYNQMTSKTLPDSTEYQETVFTSMGVIQHDSALKIAEEMVRRGVFDRFTR